MLQRGLFLVLLLCCAPSMAVEVDGLYEASVIVENRDRNQRNEAFKDALNQVLVKITGSQSIGSDDQVISLSDTAARYVSRFSYAEQEGINGFLLNVVFNQQALQQAILDRGLPLWGSNRPSVLLWMAVDERAKRYVLGERSPGVSLKDALELAAWERGIQVDLPKMDDEDLAAISFAEVNGLFADAIDNASGRYEADSVLMAKSFFINNQWRVQWRLLWDRQQYDWTTQSNALDQALAQGIGALANTMAQAMTVNSMSNLDESVIVHIDGIQTFKQQMQLRNYFSGLSQVSAVRPYRVQNRTVSYVLTLRSDVRDLERLLILNGNLEPLPAPIDNSLPVAEPKQPEDTQVIEIPKPAKIYYRWLG